MTPFRRVETISRGLGCWSVHGGSLLHYARRPCRPFRLAGACADPVVVQVTRAASDLPLVFRCYETNACSSWD
eukprot:3472547-Amphidinium_carterae.1